MTNKVKAVKGAAIYESGTDKGKPCVWMTVRPDEHSAETHYYVIQHCRTMEAANKAAEKWQAKENKSVLKHHPELTNLASNACTINRYPMAIGCCLLQGPK